MFKSKLQEMCHKEKWAPPKYSCMKDGPDHSPQFKGSVVVNGMNFDTTKICNSSKEAYNEAAKLAFSHFTSENWTSQDLKIEEASHSDVQQQYKKMLLTFVQREKLGFPVYHSEGEGPDEFKSTVIIGNESFKGPGSYKTVEEAENAAAQTALASLAVDAFRGNNRYKNLLQELAQSEGFYLPIYKTTRSGEPHKPSFYSSVEVEGEIFHGDGANSKKQAELNAAKVAYIAIINSKTSPADSQGNTRPGKASVSPPSMAFDAQAAESNDEIGDELDSKFGILVNSKVSTLEAMAFDTLSDAYQSRENTNSVSSLGIPSDDSKPSPEIMPHLVLSALPVGDQCTKKTDEVQSFLLCNRFKVYTCFPEICLPKGTVVLQISEDKWVTVSLEFPNEKI